MIVGDRPRAIDIWRIWEKRGFRNSAAKMGRRPGVVSLKFEGTGVNGREGRKKGGQRNRGRAPK